jgi:excisionase family DNA binding protein
MPTTVPAPRSEESAETPSPWLTYDEAAAYCKVKLRTFERWVAEGRVVRHKVAGMKSVRFHRDDLDALMKPVD